MPRWPGTRRSWRGSRAGLGKLQLDVRQAVLDAWLELETLYAARQAASDYTDYRDLYLDLNRAL